MMRPFSISDKAALLSITEQTGVFKPHEIEALSEVFDDYDAVNHTFGHVCQVWENDSAPVGFVYFAPTAMTDRTWELWWIVVEKSRQGSGLGTQLLGIVEAEIASSHGRLLVIETSSTPPYEPTRRFYRKHGYQQIAQLPDFYCDGDDKVIFARRIPGAVIV
jgi:ribosomal protein S18 acetylase RimI-like enzyme